MPQMLLFGVYRVRIARNLLDDARTSIQGIRNRSGTGEDDEPLECRSQEAEQRVRDDCWISDIALCSLRGHGLPSFEHRNQAQGGLLRRGGRSNGEIFYSMKELRVLAER